ncbi:cyclic nucleotide-binding domain-containing protein [Toxoplasma gondii CAST]|uniref:Cyclic nucleotide-binding domain-containing protein n=1 Tax=Toxoplasma gondii CAST TaxID=943122 RepID=A0A425I2W5_TOXGO|nr:cyclic nucleotide-binding domain-containing protein [Toxoplasma gondii CAST]
MPPEGGRRSREPRPSFSVSFASCPALEEPERGDTPGSPGSEERRQDGATEASDEGERQRAFRDTLQLFNTPPSERTATDVRRIQELGKGNKFFKELDADICFEVCRHMSYLEVEENRVLFHKGDAADKWYLILRGAAGVYVNETAKEAGAIAAAPDEETGGPHSRSSFSAERRVSIVGYNDEAADEDNDPSLDFSRIDLDSCVAVLGVGDSFGELGLIRNDVRSAALITKTACAFLTLDKASFDQCLRTSLQRKTDEKVTRLRAVLPGVRDLRRLIVEQMSYFFHLQTFPKDFVFVKEGDRSDALFLLLEGECVLRHHRKRFPGDFGAFRVLPPSPQMPAEKLDEAISRMEAQMTDGARRDIWLPGSSPASQSIASLSEHCDGVAGAIFKSSQVAGLVASPSRGHSASASGAAFPRDSAQTRCSSRAGFSSSPATRASGRDPSPAQTSRTLQEELHPTGRRREPRTPRAERLNMEEVDVGFLARGAVVCAASVLFDLEEPLTVAVRSATAVAFKIDKADLYRHLPTKVQDALRRVSYLFALHLHARIQQQRERLNHHEGFQSLQGSGLGASEASLGHTRGLPSVESRVASRLASASGSFLNSAYRRERSCPQRGGDDAPGPPTRSHLLPLESSPFMSPQKQAALRSHRLPCRALTDHFDRFTRSLAEFQPHKALLHRSQRLAALQTLRESGESRGRRASPLSAPPPPFNSPSSPVCGQPAPPAVSRRESRCAAPSPALFPVRVSREGGTHAGQRPPRQPSSSPSSLPASLSLLSSKRNSVSCPALLVADQRLRSDTRRSSAVSEPPSRSRISTSQLPKEPATGARNLQDAAGPAHAAGGADALSELQGERPLTSREPGRGSDLEGDDATADNQLRAQSLLSEITKDREAEESVRGRDRNDDNAKGKVTAERAEANSRVGTEEGLTEDGCGASETCFFPCERKRIAAFQRENDLDSSSPAFLVISSPGAHVAPPTLSDASLEYFFTEISRDAVAINDHWSCSSASPTNIRRAAPGRSTFDNTGGRRNPFSLPLSSKSLNRGSLYTRSTPSFPSFGASSSAPTRKGPVPRPPNDRGRSPRRAFGAQSAVARPRRREEPESALERGALRETRSLRLSLPLEPPRGGTDIPAHPSPTTAAAVRRSRHAQQLKLEKMIQEEQDRLDEQLRTEKSQATEAASRMTLQDPLALASASKADANRAALYHAGQSAPLSTGNAVEANGERNLHLPGKGFSHGDRTQTGVTPQNSDPNSEHTSRRVAGLPAANPPSVLSDSVAAEVVAAASAGLAAAVELGLMIKPERTHVRRCIPPSRIGAGVYPNETGAKGSVPAEGGKAARGVTYAAPELGCSGPHLRRKPEHSWDASTRIPSAPAVDIRYSTRVRSPVQGTEDMAADSPDRLTIRRPTIPRLDTELLYQSFAGSRPTFHGGSEGVEGVQKQSPGGPATALGWRGNSGTTTTFGPAAVGKRSSWLLLVGVPEDRDSARLLGEALTTTGGLPRRAGGVGGDRGVSLRGVAASSQELVRGFVDSGGEQLVNAI